MSQYSKTSGIYTQRGRRIYIEGDIEREREGKGMHHFSIFRGEREIQSSCIQKAHVFFWVKLKSKGLHKWRGLTYIDMPKSKLGLQKWWGLTYIEMLDDRMLLCWCEFKLDFLSSNF